MSTSASSSAPSAAVLAQQSKIRALIASNLYDTKIVSELEENVKFQVKTGSYDAESNRELLKLYAVAPDMIKSDILSRLLVKCLMELPAPDFFTSMYLVHESLHSLDSVKFLLKLQQLLETCQFKKFWKELDGFKGNVSNAAVINFGEVKDFDSSIRRFISLTVQATYSAISREQLKDLWNLTDKKAFDELVAQSGWKLVEDGKTIEIRAAPANSQGKDGQHGAQQRTDSVPSMEALAKLIAHTV